MGELDAALRTMLRERAGDITKVSQGLLDLADRRPELGPVRRTGQRRGWSVAAAVACVLLVLGVVTLLRHDTFGSQPNRAGRLASPEQTFSARPTPTTPSKSTSLPPTAHAARTVSLASILVRPLPGYAVHERASQPGYRSVAVRAHADHGRPVGCNGCESATAYIYVFDAGRFNPATYGVSTWPVTSVRGDTAHLGRMTWLGAPEHQVPTIAWQFAPSRWALVQGVTFYGGRTSALTAIAAAVEPGITAPLFVPFRLTWTPDLPVTSVIDDRSEGYALTLTLGHNSDTRYNNPQIDLTVWPHDPRSVPHTAKNRITIDQQVGWYDRARGVANISVAGATLEIGISDTGALSVSDRTILDRLLAGLRIPRSGSAVAAEQALP